MSREIGIRDYLESEFGAIRERLKHIDEHLATQNGRIAKQEERGNMMAGAIGVWKWIAGSGGLLGLVALLWGIFGK